MKLNPKEYDLSRCTGDDSRLNLREPYLLASGEIVATNGHILAVIPGVKSETDTEGWVSLEAIKAAKGAEISANGSLAVENGPSFPRPNSGNETARYPDVLKVRDGAAKSARPIVTLNADYILACAKAIKADSKRPRTVTLWATGDDPAKVHENAWFITLPGSKTLDLTEPHAIIMPARP